MVIMESEALAEAEILCHGNYPRAQKMRTKQIVLLFAVVVGIPMVLLVGCTGYSSRNSHVPCQWT